jgi:hypothetical protein
VARRRRALDGRATGGRETRRAVSRVRIAMGDEKIARHAIEDRACHVCHCLLRPAAVPCRIGLKGRRRWLRDGCKQWFGETMDTACISRQSRRQRLSVPCDNGCSLGVSKQWHTLGPKKVEGVQRHAAIIRPVRAGHSTQPRPRAGRRCRTIAAARWDVGFWPGRFPDRRRSG